MDSDHYSLFRDTPHSDQSCAFPKSWASNQDYNHWLLEQGNLFIGLEPRDASDRHIKHQVNGAKTSQDKQPLLWQKEMILPKASSEDATSNNNTINWKKLC
jgi:hypothetical protein